MICCGKIVCSGCNHAPVYDNEGNVIREKTCPFCRTPFATSDEEMIKRYKKRVEVNDAIAIRNFGGFYAGGQFGLPQNMAKALELWHRAGDLGDAVSFHNIGIAYDAGDLGVDRDEKKSIHYFKLAAMMGDVKSRNYLGVSEAEEGKMDRALKHFMIALRGGDSDSLKKVGLLYKNGDAIKDDYTKALLSYQAYLDEIKSPQRDEAAAYSDENKYYGST